MPRAIPVRHGSFVFHVGTVTEAVELTIGLKASEAALAKPPLVGEVVPPCPDSSIRGKLMNFNLCAMQTLTDEADLTFKGLGQAESSIRRLLGSKWSRKMCEWGVAWNVVRHLREVDVDAELQAFTHALKQAGGSKCGDTDLGSAVGDLCQSPVSTREDLPAVLGFDGVLDKAPLQEPQCFYMGDGVVDAGVQTCSGLGAAIVATRSVGVVTQKPRRSARAVQAVGDAAPTVATGTSTSATHGSCEVLGSMLQKSTIAASGLGSSSCASSNGPGADCYGEGVEVAVQLNDTIPPCSPHADLDVAGWCRF